MSDYGFDFRATSGFVTDPSNCSAVLATDTYPKTYSNGATAGYIVSTNLGSRDRNSSNDARLAGMHFNDSTATVFDFRVDIVAEAKSIRYASGDPTYSVASTNKIELFDGANSFDSMTAGTSAGNHFLDATHAERTSDSDWVTNNAAISHTFSATTFHLKLSDGTNNAFISHLRITTVAGGGGSPPPPQTGQPFHRRFWGIPGHAGYSIGGHEN